jgi:hypothetical protein
MRDDRRGQNEANKSLTESTVNTACRLYPSTSTLDFFSMFSFS